MGKTAEVIFDSLYLSVTLVLGVYLLILSKSEIRTLWGVMAIVLVTGDVFHLLPRMATVFSQNEERYLPAQGVGKLIASITMTLFYLLLWHCGLLAFSLSLPVGTALIYALAITRIIFCLSPRNGWTEPTPSYNWAVYRNIPFLLLGMLVLWLYARHGAEVPELPFVWIAISLSFLFYLPVVLFAGRYPKLGMLMLPKSCAYVWIVVMGLA